MLIYRRVLLALTNSNNSCSKGNTNISQNQKYQYLHHRKPLQLKKMIQDKKNR